MKKDHKHRILIVDDDRTSAELVRNALSSSSGTYETVVASSGIQALEILKNKTVDLILLDVLMSDMDGYEVCRKIKAMPGHADIPVIFITCLGKTEEKIEGFKVGAVDYLVKPIDVEEAKARIRTHLKIKEYQDELKQASEIILRTQTALVESAKMSAIGSFVTGVAHEFNNILFMMKGYAGIVREDSGVAELKQSLEVMQALIDRGAKIVKSLLDYSRKEEFQNKEEADLVELIENDKRLMRKQLESARIACQITGEKALCLKCYPGQLSQVFINLMCNAIDAMKDSPAKNLNIHIELCRTDSGYCRYWRSLECRRKSPCGVVFFTDTGCGISEELKDKVFEPFVTTKGVTGGGDTSAPGTGLGLFISYGIVQRHGGVIFVQSALEVGSKFTVILPVDDPADHAAS